MKSFMERALMWAQENKNVLISQKNVSDPIKACDCDYHRGLGSYFVDCTPLEEVVEEWEKEKLKEDLTIGTILYIDGELCEVVACNMDRFCGKCFLGERHDTCAKARCSHVDRTDHENVRFIKIEESEGENMGENMEKKEKAGCEFVFEDGELKKSMFDDSITIEMLKQLPNAIESQIMRLEKEAEEEEKKHTMSLHVERHGINFEMLRVMIGDKELLSICNVQHSATGSRENISVVVEAGEIALSYDRYEMLDDWEKNGRNVSVKKVEWCGVNVELTEIMLLVDGWSTFNLSPFYASSGVLSNKVKTSEATRTPIVREV